MTGSDEEDEESSVEFGEDEGRQNPSWDDGSCGESDPRFGRNEGGLPAVVSGGSVSNVTPSVERGARRHRRRTRSYRRSLTAPRMSATPRVLHPGGDSPDVRSEPAAADRREPFHRRSASVPDIRATTAAPNLTARARYNARIMPDRLILVRHGQSCGNTNESLYSTTPDNAMALTELGWEQAREAGRLLKERLCSGKPVHFIISPYVRTVETFHGMASAWCDPSEFSRVADGEGRLRAWYARLSELGLSWHEDPRIREQDFGNYQEPDLIRRHKRERHRFGAFYYRFPHGESASDVYDRVSTFLDSLWRSFDTNNARNYVLVTHGICARVILARYFRYAVDQFHRLANPRNCEMITLQHDGAGRLELSGRYELELREDEPECERTRVAGYKFHRRLRVLPQESIRKVKVRMSFDG
jgi:broad specificity phosphatase PhoE